MQGYIMEVELPCTQQTYTSKSYKLNLDPVYNRFTTYKSQIRRNKKVKKINAKKQKKLTKKQKELQKIKEENPGMELDEEAFLGIESFFIIRKP